MQTLYNYLLKPLLTGRRGPLLNFYCIYFCVVPLFHLLHLGYQTRRLSDTGNKCSTMSARLLPLSLLKDAQVDKESPKSETVILIKL